MNVGGLKGVTDFEQFDNINRQKKLQGQTIDQTVTGDPDEGDQLNENDVSRQSDVYDTIAPALEVERQVKELQMRREEAERAKAERAAKLAEMAETGEEDGLTNVPLDILFKQKLEEKIVSAMGVPLKQTDGSTAPNISLATTNVAASQNLDGGTQMTKGAANSTPAKSSTPAATSTGGGGGNVAGIPQAPTVAEFHDFILDGKKPQEPKPQEAKPAPAKQGGGDLGDLLGDADKDLEFNPDDIQFSGGLDQSQAPAKAAPELSMAEQLAQQREKMRQNAEAPEKPAAKAGPELSMAEQLAQQREKMRQNAAAGVEIVKKAPAKPKDVSQMTMQE